MKKNGGKIDGNSRFPIFFILIMLGFIIFVSMLFIWSNMDRNLPNFRASETKTAIRGQILSFDNYTLATTKRVYEARVDTRSINEDKKELFIKLYSIYANASEKDVRATLAKKNGGVTLSYKIDSKQAEHLKSLAKTLLRLGVFKSYQDKRGRVILSGLDIAESGETRVYPYKDLLEPMLGYTNKVDADRVIRRKGIKGIEYFYDDRLFSMQDSYLVGPRDISNSIILNKNSNAKEAINGQSIRLCIPVRFQKIVENILDDQKEKLSAKEIIAVVMDSSSGDLLSIATSNRYDRNTIEDIGLMNINAVEYTYQPGSVMKPIIYAILLRENKIKPTDIVNGHGGRYQLGSFWITDEHKLNWTSAENVIIYSSNIGIAQLAQKLDTFAYTKGLRDFGFTQKSQIDLSHEKTGYIESVEGEVYKGTIGYGYGLQVNFMQLMRAFNVFNNGGYMVNPKIASAIMDKFGKWHEIGYEQKIQIVDNKTAEILHQTLIKVVNNGTGARAKIEGLEVGGKTGTAEIKRGGENVGYDSSFIGFVNDANKKYTIGVLVIEPTRSYFGSQSAAPIFRDIAIQMVKEGYLKQKLKEELQYR